jgi:quinol monooxygenase YgiN
MIAYLYHWKIDPSKEAQFERAWAYVTEQFRAHAGSLGSRLHRGNDGSWYGYAQWPSAEARRDARIDDPEFTEALRLMRDAAVETWPEVELTLVRDLLITDPRS